MNKESANSSFFLISEHLCHLCKHQNFFSKKPIDNRSEVKPYFQFQISQLYFKYGISQAISDLWTVKNCFIYIYHRFKELLCSILETLWIFLLNFYKILYRAQFDMKRWKIIQVRVHKKKLFNFHLSCHSLIFQWYGNSINKGCPSINQSLSDHRIYSNNISSHTLEL